MADQSVDEERTILRFADGSIIVRREADPGSMFVLFAEEGAS